MSTNVDMYPVRDEPNTTIVNVIANVIRTSLYRTPGIKGLKTIISKHATHQERSKSKYVYKMSLAPLSDTKFALIRLLLYLGYP